MAKINLREIDEEIRRLQELKAFMADPRNVSLIKRVIAPNGNGSNGHQRVTQQPPIEDDAANNTITPPVPTVRGSLLDAADKARKSFGSNTFTVTDMIQAMEANGFVFQAKDKSIAANGAIKRLVAKGRILRVEEGSAGKPAKYRLL